MNATMAYPPQTSVPRVRFRAAGTGEEIKFRKTKARYTPESGTANPPTRLPGLGEIRFIGDSSTERGREQDGLFTLELVNEAVKELSEYASFENGWDGYHAQPFSPKTVLLAQKLVVAIGKHFMRQGIAPDEITPGPASDGTIDIELRYKDKYEVFSLDPASIHINLYKKSGNKSEQEKFQLTPWSLEIALVWLTA